jgi:hypothetical protein
MIESSLTRGSERTTRLSETVTTTLPRRGSVAAGEAAGVGDGEGEATGVGAAVSDAAGEGASGDEGDDQPHPATRATTVRRTTTERRLALRIVHAFRDAWWRAGLAGGSARSRRRECAPCVGAAAASRDGGDPVGVAPVTLVATSGLRDIEVGNAEAS